MKNQLISLVFIILFFSCNNSLTNEDETKNYSKLSSSNDPFKNTIVESQYFEIDGGKDNVIEGEKGTIIFVPQGAFLDKRGNVVTEDVTLEVAEPNSLSDYILSNLTTTSDGNPLSSAGMLYVSAKKNGEFLSINPDNPLYAEIASDAEKSDMMVYYGDRDDNGKINWKDPKPLEKWLISVDLDLLNFYPPNFEAQVEMGMPFRQHTYASRQLKDSLYYSLSPFVNNFYEHTSESDLRDSLHPDSELKCNVIKPASIKVIKEKRFQNTLISTREFEKRLQTIFESCNNAILDLYVRNLDKNLWEIDSMAAYTLGNSHRLFSVFMDYSREKLTKVKDSPASKHLSAYYQKQVSSTEKAFEKTRKEYLELLKKKDKEVEKKRADYSKLLEKRQIYRLEKFGFKIEKNGYYNIDKLLKDLDTFELTVNVTDGNAYDRVHVYIVNPYIKSIFAMVSDSHTVFDKGYNEDRYLLMWKEQKAYAIVVAYKDEQPYFGEKRFNVMKKNDLTITLNSVSMALLKDTLNAYKKYSKENKIETDLAYQESFFKERKRQEQLKRERDFINELYFTLLSGCCSDMDVLKGKIVFENHCQSCHCKYSEKVGPALAGISSRRTNKWIVDFISNSQKMIIEGDPIALAIYKKYNNTQMTSFKLSEAEMLSVISYMNSISKKENCY